jgi:membrane protein
MYGMGGKRGIVRTRALSFSLYCGALVIGVIVLPLVLAGPDAVDALLPQKVDFLNQLYWPVVTILSAGFLNTLFHLSVPVRTPWLSDLPGSFLTLSIWILGSFVLRWILQSTVGGTSIYGPLAAPIAVLMWLYMTAIAVLIGAALNAVVDRLWPHKSRRDHAEAEDVHEPVMKAEPDPHHVDVVTPAEQRPEIKIARAIEAMAGSDPGEQVVPEAVAASKLPAIAKTAADHKPASMATPAKPTPPQATPNNATRRKAGARKAAPVVRESADAVPAKAGSGEEASVVPEPTGATPSKAGSGDAASAVPESAAPREGHSGEAAPVVPKAAPRKAGPVVPEGAGGRREPEPVGKSGAQADGDDIV